MSFFFFFSLFKVRQYYMMDKNFFIKALELL